MSRFVHWPRQLLADGKDTDNGRAREPLPPAYAFRTDDDSIEALRSRLNERGPWQWIERDSAWYDDYMSTVPRPHAGIIKIFQQDDGFVIQLRDRGLDHHDASAMADYRALHATILDRFLPSIGARDIRPDEGFD